MDTLFLIGRIILGGYFLHNAYNHFANTGALAGYAGSKNVSTPRLMVVVSGLLLLFGGYTIVAGMWIGWGVAALVLFLVPVTFTMHNFWKLEGQTRMMEKVQFSKNLALLGAVLCLLAISEPWALSLAV